MAVVEGGVDLKAADKAKKEAQKGLQKYKVWQKWTKKNPKKRAYRACCKTLKSGANSLVQSLEKCGYHGVVIHHTPTGVAQAGTYRPNFMDQMQIATMDFNVRVPDETGFLLPVKDENCMQDQSNHGTLDLLRNCAMDAELLKKTLKIGFDGYGWKVIKRELRQGDCGGYLVALTRKHGPTLKDGYFELFDDGQGATYWQKYNNGVADETDFSYKPSDVHNVEAGGKYSVIGDKVTFDKLGISSHTPFTTQEAWDDMCHNVLGWDVVVNEIFDGGDGWGGYNASITVDHGEGVTVDAVIPIQALIQRGNAGDTALFLGEVDMFILKAEMDLFENRGHVERGKAAQPLAAEFAAILSNFCGDEHGFGEYLDYEDEENAGLDANWVPEIGAWLQAQADGDIEFSSLGFGLD